MLRILCLKPSIKLALSIEEEPILILPIPVILHWMLSLRVTNLPFIGLREENFLRSLVICLEHPLSKNHSSFFIVDLRHSYNISLAFLGYPNHFGSSLVSFNRIWLFCFLFFVFFYPNKISLFKIIFLYITWWWYVSFVSTIITIDQMIWWI